MEQNTEEVDEVSIHEAIDSLLQFLQGEGYEPKEIFYQLQYAVFILGIDAFGDFIHSYAHAQGLLSELFQNGVEVEAQHRGQSIQ